MAAEDLGRLGFGSADVEQVVRLAGGMNAAVLRLVRWDRRSVVVKTVEGAPADLWHCEAAGLSLLAGHGLRTPAVLTVDDLYLVLEDFGGTVPEDGPFWEDLAVALVGLHSVQGKAFGFTHDNYLGTLPQTNTWCSDGYAFYARHRLLRYLEEPAVDSALDATDRAALERLCGRLDRFIPRSDPVLVHGDLWRANVVATVDGTPAVIDAAPYYCWPDVDISMMAVCGGVPRRFFDTYFDLRPPAENLDERLEVLHLREHLSALAHHGSTWGSLASLRETLRRLA